MTKKVLCILILIFTALLMLTSCASKGEGEQIVVPLDKQTEYLDPQIVWENGAKNIIANCFEGLVTYDSEGSIVPAACESYTISDNGLVYTFNLRTDGRWRVPTLAKETILDYYKGEAEYNYDTDFDLRVTADDFIFALQRVFTPETKCPYAPSLMNIKNAQKIYEGKKHPSSLGVKKEGEYKLVITLEKADSDFLSSLTLPSCMPCNEEFFEITKGHYGLYTNYLIFNGPFYISNWSEKTAITARRNEYYRATEEELRSGEVSSADIVKPQSVYFSFNNEQETRDRKIKDGTYEMAPITKEQVKPFLNNKKYTVNTVRSSVTSIILNCSDAVLSNKKLRKAIVGTVDREVLTSYFGKENAMGIVPSASLAGSKSYRSQVGSIEKIRVSDVLARELFKEAVEILEVNDIELTVLCSANNETAVRGLIQKWQSIFGASFNISVEAVENNELSGKISSGEYQIALCDIAYTDATALNALARYKGGARDNIVNYSSAAYDRLISEISDSKTEKQRLKALVKAENYLMEGCALVPVCEEEVYYVMGAGVSGIIFSPTGEVAYYKSALSK